MKYFLGLSSSYGFGRTIGHTFAVGSEMDLSELRAFLAAHYGATYDHVGIYSNGRSALAIAVKAVAKRGGKVVITSLTCYAVVQAVRAAGCVPIFADVDPETLHFGKKELEKLLETEKNVQAVIVQNNLGIPADMAGIEEVAKAHKISIIEDLAHCVGVKYADGREAGTVGRATVLSFGKGKAIDAVTGGAVILTSPLDSPISQPEKKPKKSDSIRARFYPLISAIIRGGYKISNKFGRILTGFNVKVHFIKKSADGDVDPHTRLTYWQCKLALRQLQAVPHSGTKPIRDHYLVHDREDVLYELERKGFIFNDLWYETPVAPERYFDNADFHPELCPIATRISTQIVNVPTWYDKEEMAPALKIIRKDLVDESDISLEDTVAEDVKKQVSESIKIEKKRRREKRKIKKKKNPRNRFYKAAEEGSKEEAEENPSLVEEDDSLMASSDLFSDTPGMIVSTGKTRQNKNARDLLKKAARASSKKGKELKDAMKEKAEKAAEKAAEQRAKQKEEKAKSKVKSLQERRVESLADLDEQERLDRENGDSWWLDDGEKRKARKRAASSYASRVSSSSVPDSYFAKEEPKKPAKTVKAPAAKKEFRDDGEIDPLTGMRVASRKLSEREKIIKDRRSGNYGGGSSSVI